MQPNSDLNVLDRTNYVYDRGLLRSTYATERHECKSITLIEKLSGTIHEFAPPLFGELILEHDGMKTVVRKLRWVAG